MEEASMELEIRAKMWGKNSILPPPKVVIGKGSRLALSENSDVVIVGTIDLNEKSQLNIKVGFAPLFIKSAKIGPNAKLTVQYIHLKDEAVNDKEFRYIEDMEFDFHVAEGLSCTATVKSTAKLSFSSDAQYENNMVCHDMPSSSPPHGFMSPCMLMVLVVPFLVA
jgi:hypothetical protein